MSVRVLHAWCLAVGSKFGQFAIVYRLWFCQQPANMALQAKGDLLCRHKIGEGLHLPRQ